MLDLSLDYLVTGKARRRPAPTIKIRVKKEPAHIEKRRLDARVTIMVEREMPDGKVETTSKTVVGKEAEKIIERRFPPRFLGW